MFVIAFSLLKNGFLSQILQANVCPSDAASSREKPAVPLVLCCSLLMRKCCPVLVSSAAARLAVTSKFTPAKSPFLFFFNASTSRKCFKSDLYLNIGFLGQINTRVIHYGDFSLTAVLGSQGAKVKQSRQMSAAKQVVCFLRWGSQQTSPEFTPY